MEDYLREWLGTLKDRRDDWKMRRDRISVHGSDQNDGFGYASGRYDAYAEVIANVREILESEHRCGP